MPPLPTIQPLIHKVLDDLKAQDVVTIDLRGKCDFTDAMIVASGTSSRHVAAIAERVLGVLKEAGLASVGVEGQERGDWVLIDAGDAVVHLFRPEVRAFYNLETMWADLALT